MIVVPLFQYLFGLLAWSAVSLGIGYVWFPLFAKFMDARLAWPLCRLLAVPFTTLLVLWPSVFTTIAVGPVPSLVGLAIIGFLARRLSGFDTVDIHNLLRNARPYRFELGLVAAAAGFLFVILFIASMTTSGERLHDGAIWATISLQGTYPFTHPWLAGFTAPYYFLGYLTLFQIFQFIPLSPLLTYNLALAVAPVAYALALWIFFVSLWERPRLAVAGAAIVLLSSNLKSTMQVVQAAFAAVPFQYWDSSRVLAGTINEFPLWTVTFGDLHPHLMSLWLVPATMTFVLAALRVRLVTPGTSVRAVLAIAGAAIVALSLGMHTWDVPLIATFLGATFLLVKPKFSPKADGKWIVLGIGLAIFLAAPHLKHMAGAPKSFGFVEQRSKVFEFLYVWGLFFLPLICLASVRIFRRNQRDLLAVLLLALPVSVVFQSVILLVLALMALFFCAFRNQAATREIDSVIRVLVLTALLLCLGCEIVYLKDAFSGENFRLNTVFKIYMPVWTILGCAVATALRALADEVRPHWFRPTAALWLVAASAYLYAGVPNRVGFSRMPSSLDGYGDLHKISPDEEQVIRWINQESRTPGFFGTILTGISAPYGWPGYVASFTGLPLYAAWENYSYWFHFGKMRIEHSRRVGIVKKIFDGSYFAAGDSCEGVIERLRAEKIDYVFLGKHERKSATAAGLKKLEGCLPPLYSVGDVKFLGIRPQTL